MSRVIERQPFDQCIVDNGTGECRRLIILTNPQRPSQHGCATRVRKIAGQTKRTRTRFNHTPAARNGSFINHRVISVIELQDRVVQDVADNLPTRRRSVAQSQFALGDRCQSRVSTTIGKGQRPCTEFRDASSPGNLLRTAEVVGPVEVELRIINDARRRRFDTSGRPAIPYRKNAIADGCGPRGIKTVPCQKQCPRPRFSQICESTITNNDAAEFDRCRVDLDFSCSQGPTPRIGKIDDISAKRITVRVKFQGSGRGHNLYVDRPRSGCPKHGHVRIAVIPDGRIRPIGAGRIPVQIPSSVRPYVVGRTGGESRERQEYNPRNSRIGTIHVDTHCLNGIQNGRSI